MFIAHPPVPELYFLCFTALQGGDFVQWKEALCSAAAQRVPDVAPEAQEDPPAA